MVFPEQEKSENEMGMLRLVAGIDYTSKLHYLVFCLIKIIPVTSTAHHHGAAHLIMSEEYDAQCTIMAMRPLAFGYREEAQCQAPTRPITWSVRIEGCRYVGDNLPTTGSSNWSTTTESWDLGTVVLPIDSTCSSSVGLPLTTSVSGRLYSSKSTVYAILSCRLLLDRLRAALDSVALLSAAELESV